MTKLTPRERTHRWLAGQEVDRVPFSINQDQAPHDQLYQMLGEGRFGILFWASAHRLESQQCAMTRRDFARGGYQIIERTLQTPEGSLVEERTVSPTGEANVFPIITKHMVCEPADYRILQAYFRDLSVVPDDSRMRRMLEQVGPNGAVQTMVDRTPYQAMAMQWVGPETLSFHLADEPDVVLETMAVMGEVLMREAEAAVLSDATHFCSADNITAPLIGRPRFEQYVMPWYRKLADVFAPRRYFVHMDGDLAGLADLIGKSGVGGIDSMSPPPDNDMSVAAAVAQWPDMRLGVNFPSSVHIRSEQEIYETATQILRQGAESRRLQIQISENLPPGRWKQSFPQIIRAIEDFCNKG